MYCVFCPTLHRYRSTVDRTQKIYCHILITQAFFFFFTANNRTTATAKMTWILWGAAAKTTGALRVASCVSEIRSRRCKRSARRISAATAIAKTGTATFSNANDKVEESRLGGAGCATEVGSSDCAVAVTAKVEIRRGPFAVSPQVNGA